MENKYPSKWRMYLCLEYVCSTNLWKKLFNHLPLKIKSLSNEIKLFKPVLKKFLNLHSFYSVEEYLEYSIN